MSFKLAGAALALALALPSFAAQAPLGPLAQPLWLRQSSISPDGTQIAFTFQGNLYVVPAAGGAARLLVANGHHTTAPVWSPDGRLLAYAADVYGNNDVFLVAAEGGPSRRLTSHSAPETPIAFTPDGRAVLFSAQRQDVRSSLAFPSPALGELYKVGIEGGRRPEQVFSEPAMAGRYNKAGTQLVYEDWKGYENAARKHHISPVARDIWLWDAASGQHRKLTNNGGENRNPVWSPDEQSIYFLSEKSGSFNVWKMQPGQPEAARQITHFTKNPVRFLSVAANGVLSFGYDGELYTMAGDTAEPRKLGLSIGADALLPKVENLRLSEGATDMAVSPDGSEFAVVVRGQVFVASTEFGNTRRITEGPGQKRSVSFSPDGRRLLYACEQDGQWSLCEAALQGDKKAVPSFFNAPRVSTRVLLKDTHQNFQPRYSPDGKEVAYLQDRAALHVLDIASGNTRELLSADWNYSYEDGDQWFDWAPDGKSLAVQFTDRNRWGQEAGVVPADGSGKLVNLTNSGYDDLRPMFARQGQMMIWASDRHGLHGNGGGARNDLDVYGMFLTRAAFDRYQLDKADFAQLKKREDDEKKDEAKKDDKKPADKKEAEKKDDKKAEARPEPVVIEQQGLEDRVARLSTVSGDIRDYALTPDGEQLFYVAKAGEGFELWQVRLRDKEGRRVASLPGGRGDNVSLVLDAKGANGFVMAAGRVHKFKVPGDDGKGDVKAEPLKFAAELRIDHAAERAQMFDHAWRQTREKLYVADMGGVDWAGYRQVYERQLPYVADGPDFAELLSEMLGELNVSHTGAGYRPAPQGDATASLGVFYDAAHKGAGVKVAEVIEGGPLDTAAAQLKAGMVIASIDGEAIPAGAEFDSLLNLKAGKQVVLEVLDPATGRRFEQTLKAISLGAERELLYKRWVRQERALVDKLSGGRLGYVHVRGMNDGSYRQTYADALGRASGKEALIVDTRFNGGGNLHDELATLLSGKKYLEFLPRGQSLGWEPTGKWTKPSAVLISESNYSDAHLFPWTYKHLGIGKLIGMPVAGTGTAVWWETMQDGATTFGIPQVGFRAQNGEFMERALITPDIVVPNDKARLDAGEDQQLEAAVKSLLGK
ncbi:S41 family peptidase [Roseateles saccharophilus]|uniref:Tricorn protease homolog n=1 Tax=Roseateles saccharophilus TaxID=304 RepID=A0A4V2VPG6_ROSSA|nr:S41 family peptidase [Roseateles saccharophilus]MDG0834190.1 peptidase S41 [Roseateles saccharophilus]TCU89948.1 C-terminal processing protease CtpA/Prc [Roseateles saccharophilus]